MDEEGNQFVAYFLPNEETLRKRKRDFEEGVDYMAEDLWVKNIKKKKKNTFFFFAFFFTLQQKNSINLRAKQNKKSFIPFLCFRYDYKIAREYNWNVKNKASKGYEENYFFIFRDGDGVYYNELETRSGLLYLFSI